MMPHAEKTREAVEALQPALTELYGAQAAYEAAKSDEDVARRASTEAVNRLNRAQKEVDQITSDMKQAGGGDWASQRNRALHKNGGGES